MDNMQSKGSLVCVGLGMTLGSHISPISRSFIENADVVFVLASDGVVEQWVSEMNEDVRSLQLYYHEGESRADSYQQMINVILDSVRKGLQVVGAFYGHPGVFACVSHLAIEQANELGCYTKMEPGISAEDCLYADLGIDPGESGCAHYETSQFMFYKRQIDTAAYLVLWQVGIAGDVTLTKFSTDEPYRRVLVDLLSEFYSPEQEVILYEAPTLPIHQPRKETLKLLSLVTAQINQHTTLVVPPNRSMVRNESVCSKLSSFAKHRGVLQLV